MSTDTTTVRTAAEGPRYPHIHVSLVGQDANAFAMIGRTMVAMREAGIDQATRARFEEQATSGDYANVIAVISRWISIEPGISSLHSGTGATPAPGAQVFTLPAGTYRLGDPCYSIGQDDWLRWLDAADYTKATHLFASLHSRPVLGLGTKYGDGEYLDAYGKHYGVDAGLIGLVPVDLPGLQVESRSDEELARAGVYHQVTFETEVTCWADENGTLHFGDIAIFTGDQEEDEEYEEQTW